MATPRRGAAERGSGAARPGDHSGRGAQGVGRATTNAVVGASILILAANYMLTEFFFAGA